MFGLTNSEGNHGEDVKEYYFYLDSTPTHSYMKMLYKYPQERISLWRSGRDKPAARSQRTGVRIDRYRRIQRRSLFRCLRRIRQEDANRHPDPDQRVQSRPRRGADARASHALVPQYLDMVARNAEAFLASRHARRTASRASRRPMPNSATISSIAKASRRCCSRRTRPTISGSSARPTQAAT